VVISETETVFSASASVSLILKAMVDSLCTGCADWWQGLGSIDLNLEQVSVHRSVRGRVWRWGCLLLTQKVPEECDGVLGVAD
jgi:hypothetical protein